MTAPASSPSSLVALGAAVALPDPAAPRRDRPSRECNGGGCGGWFRSSVTVTWEFDPAGVTSTSGCGAAGVSEDTGGARLHVRGRLRGPVLRQQRDRGEGLVPAADERCISREVRTPTGGTRSPSRSRFERRRRSLRARVVHRETARTAVPTAARSPLSGTCTDNAGNSRDEVVHDQVRLDAADRDGRADAPAGRGGWYNHAVQVAFKGQDAGSGVKECSPDRRSTKGRTPTRRSSSGSAATSRGT